MPISFNMELCKWPKRTQSLTTRNDAVDPISIVLEELLVFLGKFPNKHPFKWPCRQASFQGSALDWLLIICFHFRVNNPYKQPTKASHSKIGSTNIALKIDQWKTGTELWRWRRVISQLVSLKLRLIFFQTLLPAILPVGTGFRYVDPWSVNLHFLPVQNKIKDTGKKKNKKKKQNKQTKQLNPSRTISQILQLELDYLHDELDINHGWWFGFF